MLSISEQTTDVWKPTSFTSGRTWCLADGQPLGRVPKRLLCPNLHRGVLAPGSYLSGAQMRSAGAPGVRHMHLGSVIRDILFGLFLN